MNRKSKRVTKKKSPHKKTVKKRSNKLEKYMKDLIQENNVMVFSKSYCPFCKKVKAHLKMHNIMYHCVELDLIKNGDKMHELLIKMTKQRTVPNVFVQGKHLGGCDKTIEKLESNEFFS